MGVEGEGTLKKKQKVIFSHFVVVVAIILNINYLLIKSYIFSIYLFK